MSRARSGLGVVTGLAVEASCLPGAVGRDGPSVCCAGVGPVAAASAASALLDAGCRALLSFGCAGGLDPRLASGAVLVATEIIELDGRLTVTDGDWQSRLLAMLQGIGAPVFPGRLLGSDRPLVSAAEKQRRGREFDALGVDMESHAVARIASAAGVPMLAVRAICDTAEMSLPEWLDDVIDDAGRPRTLIVLSRLLMHPSDTARVLRLAGNQRAALSALRGVALRVGGLFALD